MGANSAISWTHHTLNPWIGCAKVSPGCANCYAERDFGSGGRRARVIWGKDGTRSKTQTLKDVPKWDKAAREAGVRHRVFCASLADVFESWHEETTECGNINVLDEWRAELWPVIERCTNLDFLLLTKRPENVRAMVPWDFNWPAHVWLGTSVENQEAADKRIPHLLRCPAPVKFLSVEPMLGEVYLRRAVPKGSEDGECVKCGWGGMMPTGNRTRGNRGVFCPDCRAGAIDWVIVGSESGKGARPFDLAWARSLRDQCKAAGVAFFVKQLPSGTARPLTDPAEFPEDLRIQEIPQCTPQG